MLHFFLTVLSRALMVIVLVTGIESVFSSSLTNISKHREILSLADEAAPHCWSVRLRTWVASRGNPITS